MKNKVLSCLLMLCLLITTAPSMAWADLNDGGAELDIADGSITITESGYTQGSGSQVAWQDSENKALTITGNTTSNVVSVSNSGSSAIKITIKGLNISADVSKSLFDVQKGNIELITQRYEHAEARHG